VIHRLALAAAGLSAVALLAGPAWAQAQAPEAEPVGTVGTAETGDQMVQLDFNDVELSVVIDTIARLTGRNFIYDDRVRGRVTVISPTKISVEQAYAVFESVLQVKGFSVVPGPGGVTKIVPIRDAKEASLVTPPGRAPARERDRFVTRLIPLDYINAEQIGETLKTLISKEAALLAYGPTNTLILTDTEANIRRVLQILDSIDVETYKDELAVIKVRHADAVTLGEQLMEVYEEEPTAAGTATAAVARARARSRRVRGAAAAAPSPEGGGVVAPGAGRVRILTDERTNSLIVLASRSRLEDIRQMVKRLDVPVTGGGRINVHYLKHADAEELANTLSALISGQPAAPRTSGAAAGAGGAQAQALRAAVSELAEGVTVTADVATNSLVIQASAEGYRTLASVIDQLDIERPQVLVEALIMEVDVTDSEDLGFSGIVNITSGDTTYSIQSRTDSPTRSSLFEGDMTPFTPFSGTAPGFIFDAFNAGNFRAIVNAAASDARTNILSAPHILTSDNEEAEIRIGNNIPIITSRVQSAAGIDVNTGLSSSVNVERQDIGVTLRVTPQITEGDTLRMDIFQEITDINDALTGQGGVGDPEEVGVALTNRRVENTVVVKDGETVVIGGLLSDNYQDTVTKVPWLGDIPVLGWLFRTESRSLTKVNLLVFLRPTIVRSPEDLEHETIRKREEFRRKSEEALQLSQEEREQEEERRRLAEAAGLPFVPVEGRNPARTVVDMHTKRYPLERMLEIEQMRDQEAAAAQAKAEAAARAPQYAVVAGPFQDPAEAQSTLVELLDAGFEGTLLSSPQAGRVIFEIRLGPYGSYQQAGDAADMARSAFDLEPRIVVVPREESEGGSSNGSASGFQEEAP
jgi:general secretion pathway protein D